MPVTTNTRKLAALLGASGGGIHTDGTLQTAAIKDGAISAAKVAADMATQAELDVASTTAMKPHIRTGVLYPAVGGKGIDGSTTVTSFGTDFAITGYATLKYYYTDIKGSKPIKDPRIGSHFGSQRHMFKSLQLLEKETATHGKQVHSVDGREWVRVVEGVNEWYVENNNNGVSISVDDDATGQFLEVTGYFNDINLIGFTCTDRANNVDITVNGDSSRRVDGATTFDTAVCSKLGGRYVSAGSVLNLGTMTALLSSTVKAELGTTPAINTVKIEYMASGFNERLTGIELIAQDTTSTANKSKIQIPAQDVVSYGEKFTVAAAAHHYNPFAFAGDGTTAVAIGDTTSHGKVATGWTGATSSYFDSSLDTATSLGLAAWETGGYYYRPVNGGRVVKWVDSTGAIKTSVNMMPPCATAITAGSDASLPTSHAWTTVYQPKIKSGTIDNSQAEVSKTFHPREFGNGSANQGHGGSYQDATMTDGADNQNFAYVMDDGLTSLSASGVYITTAQRLSPGSDGSYVFFTFIGTGVGLDLDTDGRKVLAQNLPYGTHILKVTRDADASPVISIDGVTIYSTGSSTSYSYGVDFFQPKLPPIPENACILADYMLYADWVPLTAGTTGLISKGARTINCSRDIFYERDSGAGTPTFVHNPTDSNGGANFGFQILAHETSPMSCDLPVFSNKFAVRSERVDVAGNAMSFGGTSSTITLLDNSANNDLDAFVGPSSATDLGVNKMEFTLAGNHYFAAFDAHGVIHTSSHYQTFETPFLHELVGGDRNMEQTNLIVTPDGKSWDEVTRDVSYIGNVVVSCKPSADIGDSWQNIIYTYQRGTYDSNNKLGIKNEYWVYAYDRFICLKDGSYTLLYHVKGHLPGSGGGTVIKLNGTEIFSVDFNPESSWRGNGNISYQITAKRGDYVENTGYNVEGNSSSYAHFAILKH